MKRLSWIALGLLVATTAMAQTPTHFPGPNPSGPQPPYMWFHPDGPPLWDNGVTDGSNGFSNAVVGAFGARRTLLDDFVVPPTEIWSVTGFSWTHVWGSGAPAGTGTGDDFRIVADLAGSPDIGTVVGVGNVTAYSEMDTGSVFFSRPEVASTATFDPIIVPAGTFWIDHTIIGPENNFHLSKATVTGNECWVNYDDLGGLQSCTAQFSAPADINYALFGTVVIPAELTAFEVE